MEPANDPGNDRASGAAPGSSACFSGRLVKRYDEKRIHADSFSLELDVDIHSGTTHGILGHSGSGKSTLLNLLAILDTPSPDSRDLRMDFKSTERGECSYQWRRDGWHQSNGSGARRVKEGVIRRRHFGFVFQAGHLSPNLTAAQNVMFPLALADADRRAARDKATSLLEKVGLTSRLHRALPRNLSGGEYQRVAVARALAHDPDVVFADEPTGNLDPDAGIKVMDALHEWREADPGRTLILVTHNIDQALDYCDRLTVLRGGKAVGDAAGKDGGGRSPESNVPSENAARIDYRTAVEEALKPRH